MIFLDFIFLLSVCFTPYYLFLLGVEFVSFLILVIGIAVLKSFLIWTFSAINFLVCVRVSAPGVCKYMWRPEIKLGCHFFFLSQHLGVSLESAS